MFNDAASKYKVLDSFMIARDHDHVPAHTKNAFQGAEYCYRGSQPRD